MNWKSALNLNLQWYAVWIAAETAKTNYCTRTRLSVIHRLHLAPPLPPRVNCLFSAPIWWKCLGWPCVHCSLAVSILPYVLHLSVTKSEWDQADGNLCQIPPSQGEVRLALSGCTHTHTHLEWERHHSWQLTRCLMESRSEGLKKSSSEATAHHVHMYTYIFNRPCALFFFFETLIFSPFSKALFPFPFPIGLFRLWRLDQHGSPLLLHAAILKIVTVYFLCWWLCWNAWHGFPECGKRDTTSWYCEWDWPLMSPSVLHSCSLHISQVTFDFTLFLTVWLYIFFPSCLKHNFAN